MGRGRSQKSRDLVETAAEILEAVQPCSVRAVCYQLFTRGLIDDMSKATTNRVGALLTRAREEGDIPWTWVVQEGRAVESVATWDDPAAYARAVQSSYRRNKWAGQSTRVIVLSEKGTVRGTLAPILDEFEVDFLPVGGYASATRVHELASIDTTAQPLVLLYLGDSDPSGRGMSDQDLPRRLVRYASNDPADKGWSEAEIERAMPDMGLEIRRIALTVEDTETLGPDLGFPASDKAKDPRYALFVTHFGHRCWELDAMNPALLRTRVEDAIRAELDLAEWERYVVAERVERESITRTLQTWSAIPGLASK